MKQDAENFQLQFEAFVQQELAQLSAGQLNQSSTCTLLACAYFSGAAEALAVQLKVDKQECQPLLTSFFREKLDIDAVSDSYWFNIYSRLVVKYPLVRDMTNRGGMAMLAWLVAPEHRRSELTGYLDEYKHFSFLDAEVDFDIEVGVTMTEQQRVEFNARYQGAESPGDSPRRYFMWLLLTLFFIEVGVLAWYYDLI